MDALSIVGEKSVWIYRSGIPALFRSVTALLERSRIPTAQNCFSKIRENATPWKELLTIYVAPSIICKNRSNEAQA